MSTKWKVSINGELNTIGSEEINEKDQFIDIRKKVHKKMNINKKTLVRPEIYIINKIK